MQVRKLCGFAKSFQSLNSSTSIRPDSGVTIKVPSSSPKTQFNINVVKTSSYTCTSSESSFTIKLLKCSFSLQKIKFQAFSQSLLHKRVFKTLIYVRCSGSCHYGGIGSNSSFLLLLCYYCKSFNPISSCS